MSKKRKNRGQPISNPALPNDLGQLTRYRRELETQEMLLIEKALRSDSPQAIIKAQEYIRGLEQKKESTIKSFTAAPEHEFYSGMGYKNRPTSITYDLLRQMAKVPQIAAIIQTRVDQAMNYSQFTTDMQRPGWTIKKKTSRFAEDKDKELTSADKRNIDSMVDWIERGGNDVNEWEGDDWDEFRKKVYRDSWELDQGAFEVSWLRKGIPHQYQAVDGGTIRLAENFEDRQYQEERAVSGYLPKYVQVWKNQVYREYYPWELCLGMRNTTSNVRNNGYSNSELEILIQVITWMLYGMQYNGNFFQQGSNPKGILNFKGNIDPIKIEEFKQAWRNTLSGVMNSHKMAVTSGSDLEWISMQTNNKDMEFHQWNEFLTVLACTHFRIDPDEVGFHLKGSQGMFGQDGQKERIKHSKEKGLEPFMRYWQTQFDKYMIKPLSGGKYEFVYTGLDPEDEKAVLDRDVTLLEKGGISLQDFFMKYSSRELDTNKDIILNQVALQYKQMDAFGGQESNEAVDEMTGESEGNPYADYQGMEKSDDPFLKAFNSYLGESGITRKD
jgi:hypothetical protein